MGWVRTTALLLALTRLSSAYASTMEGQYFAYRNFGCGEFTEAYTAEKSARAAANDASGERIHTFKYDEIVWFITGWLTHFNSATPDTYNMLPNGLLGAILWLDSYCKSHPLNGVIDGLFTLTNEAYPSRQQQPPR